MVASSTTITYQPTDPRLGRHVEHDIQSKNFAFKVTVPRPDATIFWSDGAPVLNQGDLGGCVGWTGADVLNTDAFTPIRKKFNGGKYYNDKDGLKFYEAATVADSIKGAYPPDDTGSSGLGLAKALKKLGLIDRYTHILSWSAYIQAIQTQPVCIGTLWTNRMFTPDRYGMLHVGTLTEDNIAGGHEYMIRGRDHRRALNLMRNHWEPSWSPGTQAQKLPGEAWISDADLKVLLANQGDGVVLHGVGLP